MIRGEIRITRLTRFRYGIRFAFAFQRKLRKDLDPIAMNFLHCSLRTLRPNEISIEIRKLSFSLFASIRIRLNVS